MINQITSAAERLDAWIEQEEFKGWDPFDALNSPLLKRLTRRNRRLGQVWVQLFKRSPINLRSAFGIPKDHNPKAMGLFLASYARKYMLTAQQDDSERAHFFADWLASHASAGYSGHCWGYNFDWPNRDFFAPAGTPTLVSTSFIGLAFVDTLTLSHFCGVANCDGTALSVARSACEFVLRDLRSICPAADERCFSYTPRDTRWVHNANALGAWLLAEVATRTTEPELAEVALSMARYTARRQRPDGTWPYGEGRKDAWVDNFHTGYVLVALKGVAQCLETSEFEDVIRRGYETWKAMMFLEDGTPKYYVNRLYPIDVHCVAQSILTFLAFTDRDPEAMAWACRVAWRGIEHLQDEAGFFHYQIHPAYRIRIPYMRWAQAWMQRSLTELLISVSSEEHQST